MTTTAPSEPAGDVAAFATRMHVELSGPEGAPPLLVLPGWGSSAAIMRSAAAPLADAWRIHSLDLPGHGRTPPPPGPWGVPEFAALVAHYVRTAGIAPLPVIGHSNGGRIALHMAGDPATADLFTRLVLVSPSGVRRRATPAALLRRAWAALLKAPFRLLPDGPLRQRGLRWVRTTVYWRLIASTDYLQAGDTLRETFVRTVNHYVEDRLPRIGAPVLLVWGDRDTDVVREQMDLMVTRLPHARLEVLSGAGHYGFIDAPAAYASAVRSFLSSPPAG